MKVDTTDYGYYEYGCGGDSYCQAQWGANSKWRMEAVSSTQKVGACYTGDTRNGWAGSYQY